MKTLDELFNTARNRKPPLSKEEVQNIVDGAKPVVPAKASALKTILFYSIPIVAVVATVIVLQNQNAAENKKQVKQPHKNIEKQPDAIAENSVVTKPLLVEQKTLAVSEPERPRKEINRESGSTIKAVTPAIKTEEREKIKPVERKSEPELKKIDEETSIYTPAKQKDESIQAETTKTQKPLPKNIEANSVTDTVAEKAVPLKTAYKTEEKKHKSIHFIRTDALGYFYNGVAQQLFFKTNRIDATPLSGNKILLGYENLFHPKISLGVTFSYGFSPFTVSEERVHNDSVVVEKYENYKGIMASVDTRYYFYKHWGQGWYVGASLGYGYLQERAFADNHSYYPSLNATTIITTKGHSFGLGLMAGYKLQVGRFYVEPNFSYTIFGGSSGYFDRGETKKEVRTRYKALNRYEINFGYKF